MAKINRLNKCDKDTFLAFKNCGNLSHSQMLELGLTKTRISNYEKSGLIERREYDDRSASREAKEAYNLTSRGRSFASDRLDLSNFANPNYVQHNVELADKYIELSEIERESVQNEFELNQIAKNEIEYIRDSGDEIRANAMEERLEQMSMPDIVYTTEIGEKIAIEIVTRNYGESDIQTKIETAQELGATIEIHKA